MILIILLAMCLPPLGDLSSLIEEGSCLSSSFMYPQCSAQLFAHERHLIFWWVVEWRNEWLHHPSALDYHCYRYNIHSWYLRKLKPRGSQWLVQGHNRELRVVIGSNLPACKSVCQRQVWGFGLILNFCLILTVDLWVGSISFYSCAQNFLFMALEIGHYPQFCAKKTWW